MLASHLVSVSQTQISPLLLQHASASSATVILRYANVSRRPSHEQTRNFRFGLWKSHLDPDFHRMLQRRYRVIKHKHAEALNSKRAWDLPRPATSHRWSLKGFMHSALRGQGQRPGGRWMNMEELHAVKDEFSAPKSRGIEDVEQSALDSLFDRYKSLAAYNSIYDRTLSAWGFAASETDSSTQPKTGTARAPGNSDVSSPRSAESTHSSAPCGRTADSEKDYFIDPITNRKVFREPSGKSQPVEIPVKTFKGYRAQFSKIAPPVEHEVCDTIHLNRQVSNAASGSRKLATQTPEWARVTQEKKAEKNSQDFIVSGTVNAGDGSPSHIQGSTTDYSLENENLTYKPFRYNEPDGQIPVKPDPVAEALEEYDHRSSANSPRKVDLPRDPLLESGVKISSPTKQGRGIGAFLAKSLHSRLSAFNTADLDRHEDLDLLRASDVRSASGISRRPRQETDAVTAKRRQALEADFEYYSQDHQASDLHEIATASQNSKSKKLAQELEIERSELLNHNAHAMGRVNARLSELGEHVSKENQPTNSSRMLTGNFIRDFPEEFKASWTTDGSTTRENLVFRKEGATDAWGYDKSPKGLEISYEQELGSKIQNDEDTHAASGSPSNPLFQGTHALRLQTSLDRRQSAGTGKFQTEADPYTKEPTGLEVSYARECAMKGEDKPSSFVSSYGLLPPMTDVSEQQKNSGIPESHQLTQEKRKADRDLVREIRSIYENRYGPITLQHRQEIESKPAALESGIATALPGNQGLKSAIDMIENLERNLNEGSHLISDLHRVLTKALPAMTLCEPKEKLAAKWKDSDSQGISQPPTSTPEPTVYKILAYDPTMQAINIAETKSIVNDTSSALTPAEVLLRLSNPSKFFPHFEPLQAQGYEIVSGSGDVLVFRKVRASAALVNEKPSKTTAMPRSLMRKLINPIDGMQSIQPATGNFASPTGFVNHDLPEAPFEPPFKSGIDVRREEPVFSGQKNKWQEEDTDSSGTQKPKRMGKRLLIGAAWVAACSYAVGVVAEFFRTGGADGAGLVGF